jgi:tetratricopeptide (TPR) repeat protein
MTCPHCGTDTPVDAARCAKCGAPQSAPAGATGVFDPAAGTTPAPSSAAPPPGPTVSLDVTRFTPPPGAPPTLGAATRQINVLTAGQTLGTRYHIIRLLGIGGMGAVYHAWDAELGVAVALKVIRGDVTGDPDAAAAIERQFKRELLLARQVTHKHVVRIHDLGHIDDLTYITMPYVQGADLATVLRQGGKLSVPRALTYVRHVAEGLVAAHEAGVVHRDLKPANIMIDEDDQALITDFGIARSSSKTGSGVNAVVGTLAYMAPEQAQALPTDQRADIYAFGMMLREMLVGRAAAADGEQAVADLMQRIREAPPSLRTIDPAIPEPLDALVARCVQPDPAKRYQTSSELAAALAALDDNGHLRPTVRAAAPPPWRLPAAAAVIAAAIVAAIVVTKRGAPAPPKPIEPVSILVADFNNKTGDAVFDGALEQPLTIAMEGASFITTYPRRDALKLAQTVRNATTLNAESAQLVAVREGIKYVLAGSVSSSGGKFQLQLDAVDPAAGKSVRSATATAATKGDVLTAVGSLAAKIRTGLGDTTPESAKLAASETFTAGSIEAMREYSTAQDLQLGGQNEEALAHYRRAMALDPKFGRAYSGAANMNFRLGRRAEAEALFKQALSLMDRMTDREKHRTLGGYYVNIAGNYEKGVEEYSALVNSYPADTAGHSNLAVAYFHLLDFTKALAEGKRAVEMYPKNVTFRYNDALYAMYAGDFAGGAAEAQKVIAENPTVFIAHLPIAIDAIAKGDMAAAGHVYDEMAKTGPAGASLASLGRADLAMYSGQLDAATKELKSGIATDLAARTIVPAALKQIALAEAELAAGRRAQAVDAAHEALKLSRQLATIVPAARVLLRAGKIPEARTFASDLEGQLQKQNRAYGKILLAEIALEDKRPPAEAVDLLMQARALANVWLVSFDLGVAYVQANTFPEAVSELGACERRRGEATALFFDDKPTVRYLATLPYWIGRAQEGLEMRAAAKAHYESFIALRKDAPADPLVQDARRRSNAQ